MTLHPDILIKVVFYFEMATSSDVSANASLGDRQHPYHTTHSLNVMSTPSLLQ
jgi:hypothetical protein